MTTPKRKAATAKKVTTQAVTPLKKYGVSLVATPDGGNYLFFGSTNRKQG